MTSNRNRTAVPALGGNALLGTELTTDKAPILPLGICVADVEGGMGYMIYSLFKTF